MFAFRGGGVRTLGFVLHCLFPTLSPALPAFPGAEGFGSQTPGGRGGRIVEVTHLNDGGPGSFRAACEQETDKRIIVFRTGGVIELKGTGIQLIGDSITVAGQTAPGDGIVIKNGSFVTIGHDIIIRGLRFRPGDDTAYEAPDVRDCLGIFGPEADTSLGGGYNILIDHCSMSWGIDENVSVWFAARDVTLQWCVIGEALYNSLHPKGTHGMGLLVGPDCRRVTLHHNLLAHNNARVPLVCSGSTTEIINNVVYNWGYKAEYSEAHGTGPLFSHMIGNYFKPKTDPMDGDGKFPVRFDTPLLDSLRLATVDTAWSPVPDTTSRYAIFLRCGRNAGG
jgi:pectate lyase